MMPHASSMLLHGPYLLFCALTFSSWVIWKWRGLPDAARIMAVMLVADSFNLTPVLHVEISEGRHALHVRVSIT